MPPVSTSLLSVKPPFVKSGCIVVPVITGNCAPGEIVASPHLWRAIVDGVAPFIAADAIARPAPARPHPAFIVAPEPRGPVLKPSGRLL